MVRAGAMEDPKPDAIFALHVVSGMPTGVIGLRPAGMLASSDLLRIEVIGRATHGSSPWAGVDPIVAASQVVLSLQTVVSRQTDLTQSPVVVTIGSIQGGNRSNIIPDKVVMEGTIRTHDAAVQARVHDRVREVAKAAAQTQGAEAQVSIFSGGYPVTYNDPPLTEWALTSLRRSTGEEKVRIIPPQMGSEDFSVFTRSAPGVYFFLGVTLPGDGGIFGRAAANHSGKFMVHEPALRTGVKALATLTVDFLERGK
jgi:amidohydrolase